MPFVYKLFIIRSVHYWKIHCIMINYHSDHQQLSLKSTIIIIKIDHVSVFFISVDIVAEFDTIHYNVSESDGFVKLSLVSNCATNTEYSVVVSPEDGSAIGGSIWCWKSIPCMQCSYIAQI